MGDDLAWWAGTVIGFFVVGNHVANFLDGIIDSVFAAGAQSAGTITEPATTADELYYDATARSNFAESVLGHADKQAFAIPWSGPLREDLGIS